MFLILYPLDSHLQAEMRFVLWLFSFIMSISSFPDLIYIYIFLQTYGGVYNTHVNLRLHQAIVLAYSNIALHIYLDLRF